jgi:multiple sugar transport system permease protein
MQADTRKPKQFYALPSIVTFVSIFVILLIIAIINAPTMGGPKVMNSFTVFIQEVRATALPFLAVIAVVAIVIGLVAVRTINKVWGNPRLRRETLTGFAFLAPYLIVTLTFTIGVVLFAFYISFHNYDIFTRPTWAGLSNYAAAFKGFSDPTKRDFLQALYNVLWYSILVVPTQTFLAIQMAVLLNKPMKGKQVFRTIFYAPSVTSSVVITLIFVWLYLKGGYVNALFNSIWNLFGGKWTSINWLGDPRGLIQMIVEAFGGKIPSTQWFFRGPSIAWMAIMVQNIFTTVPTFMIMFLAALQDINPALYEAASIEGATPRQMHSKITLPMLKPIVSLVVVLGTIGTLQVFDQVYLATKGGPLKTSLTPVFLVYQEALGVNGPIHMGYASALAFILAVIIFIFTFIQRRGIEKGTERY